MLFQYNATATRKGSRVSAASGREVYTAPCQYQDGQKLGVCGHSLSTDQLGGFADSSNRYVGTVLLPLTLMAC